MLQRVLDDAKRFFYRVLEGVLQSVRRDVKRGCQRGCRESVRGYFEGYVRKFIYLTTGDGDSKFDERTKVRSRPRDRNVL